MTFVTNATLPETRRSVVINIGAPQHALLSCVLRALNDQRPNLWMRLGQWRNGRSCDRLTPCRCCSGAAATHLDDYEAALETALAACAPPAADRDTVCPIVGSIVVLSSGFDSIPAPWLESREPFGGM